jgi:hypothetical protein
LGPDGKSIGCVVPSNKATCGDTDITGQTPLAADRLAANRIVIAADMVFESIDYGHSVQIVDGLSGMATQALVYGGRSQGTDNADLLYVGSTAGLFIRTARSGPLTATNWSVTKQGTPIKMSVDPKDWRSAWVASSGLMVWHTPDAGETWTNASGDLAPNFPSAGTLRSIAYIPATSGPIVAVGANDGIYVTTAASPSHWLKLSGSLPDAIISDLRYDVKDDKLIIATFGRSLWSMPLASGLVVRAPAEAVPPR